MKKMMLKSAVKLLSIFGFLCILTEAESDNKVQLNLKAVVDKQLNIIRIDNNGDINIFDRPETKYQVISNLRNNVKVSVQTKNNWKLVKEDAKSPEEAKEEEKEGDNTIDYYADFKSLTQTVRLGKGKDNTVINQSDFQENCSEFSLVFGVDEAMKTKRRAGTYGDTVTVHVTADK